MDRLAHGNVQCIHVSVMKVSTGIHTVAHHKDAGSFQTWISTNHYISITTFIHEYIIAM